MPLILARRGQRQEDLCSSWTTQWVLGLPGLQRETLSHKVKAILSNTQRCEYQRQAILKKIAGRRTHKGVLWLPERIYTNSCTHIIHAYTYTPKEESRTWTVGRTQDALLNQVRKYWIQLPAMQRDKKNKIKNSITWEGWGKKTFLWVWGLLPTETISKIKSVCVWQGLGEYRQTVQWLEAFALLLLQRTWVQLLVPTKWLTTIH